MVEITDPGWVSLERLTKETRFCGFERGNEQDLSKKRKRIVGG